LEVYVKKFWLLDGNSSLIEICFVTLTIGSEVVLGCERNSVWAMRKDLWTNFFGVRHGCLFVLCVFEVRFANIIFSARQRSWLGWTSWVFTGGNKNSFCWPLRRDLRSAFFTNTIVNGAFTFLFLLLPTWQIPQAYFEMGNSSLLNWELTE